MSYTNHVAHSSPKKNAPIIYNGWEYGCGYQTFYMAPKFHLRSQPHPQWSNHYSPKFYIFQSLPNYYELKDNKDIRFISGNHTLHPFPIQRIFDRMLYQKVWINNHYSIFLRWAFMNENHLMIWLSYSNSLLTLVKRL